MDLCGYVCAGGVGIWDWRWGGGERKMGDGVGAGVHGSRKTEQVHD